jgi:hypothetical protein
MWCVRVAKNASTTTFPLYHGRYPPQSPALGLLSPVEQVTQKKIPLPCPQITPQIPLSSAVAEKGQTV